MVVDVLERAQQQILNAFDAFDKPQPDLDLARLRIAGAMAAAQVIRAQVIREAMRQKIGVESKRLTEK